MPSEPKEKQRLTLLLPHPLLMHHLMMRRHLLQPAEAHLTLTLLLTLTPPHQMLRRLRRLPIVSE